MPKQPLQNRPKTTQFAGFEPLTGNYVYCPNQFLDVCLPNCSRGAVRIVAYVLRQTLGWLDEQGQPLQQDIVIRYRDLIEKAGVSRGAIGPALEEVLRLQFLECRREGQEQKRGQVAQSAEYALRWSADPTYTKDLDNFSGFFAGDGHRTPVPNAFFDMIVPTQSLSVVKVVGAVIRHTVGYQNQFGGRRSSSPLSYSHLQNHTLIQDRGTLSTAIKQAQHAGYITCVESGIFHADRNAQRAASYAMRWLGHEANIEHGSKIPPESARFKKSTSNGSKNQPETRFNNPTSIKKTKSKDTLKQQVVADQEEGTRILTAAGMDRKTAQQISQQVGVQQIRQQVEWLDDRHPTENRIGMLRKAIAENWGPPRDTEARQKIKQLRDRRRQSQQLESVEDRQVRKMKQERAARTRRLAAEWKNASPEQRRIWIDEAVKRETSEMVAQLIRRDALDVETPRLQVLDAIALDRNLPSVTLMNENAGAGERPEAATSTKSHQNVG